MDNSNSSGENEQLRKLFLGGLSFNTTEESVEAYFQEYGKITDCVVVKHKDGDRKPRGFGFVTFDSSASVDAVIQAKKDMKGGSHVLDERDIDVKRALPKEEGGSKESTNKAFVGGLAPGTTVEELKAYFSEHGTVTDVSIPPSTEGKRRVFGFVTFEDSDSVDKLIILQNFNMNGRNLEVSKAQRKDRSGRGGFQSGRGGRDFGGRGGRGGRGGYRSGGGDQGGYGGSRYSGGGGYSSGSGGYSGSGGSYGNGGGYGGNSGNYSDFGSGYSQQSSSGPMRSSGGGGGGGGGGYGGRNAPYSGGYSGNSGGGSSGYQGGGGNYSSGGNSYSGGYGGGYGGNSGGRNY